MSKKIKVKSASRQTLIGFGFIMPVILLAIFLFASICAALAIEKDRQYMVQTTATIVYIDVVKDVEYEYIDGEKEKTETIEHIVYVDYFVDGTPYRKVRLDSYSMDMKVGNELQICYDNRNPERITLYRSYNLGVVFAIAVVGAYLLSLIIIISVTKKNNRYIKELKKYGECYRLPITKFVDEYLVEIDTSQQVEFCPRVALLRVMYNDTPYFSERIKFTKDVRIGDTVNLYLDGYNAKQNRKSRVKNFRKTVNKVSGYYIDLNSIEREV